MQKPESLDLPSSTFPDTTFIDNVAGQTGPLGKSLIRSVYLAQFFGQSDARLTDYFAGVAVREPGPWSQEDRRHYPEAYRRTELFFERENGAAQLAEASTLTGNGADASEVAIARGIKEDFLTRSWRYVVDHRPSDGQVRAGADPLIYVRKELGKIAGEQASDLNAIAFMARPEMRCLQRFIGVDRNNVIAGRRPGMYEDDPHESFVREVVLAHPSRPTGSAIFNIEFAVKQVAADAVARRAIRQLGQAWQSTHKTAAGTFLPPEFDNPADILFQGVGRRLFAPFHRSVMRLVLGIYVPKELR